MKFKTALLLAALGAAPLLASAQSAPLTREQVRAELFQAIRSGDIMGSGESSMTLRQMNPVPILRKQQPRPRRRVSKCSRNWAKRSSQER